MAGSFTAWGKETLFRARLGRARPEITPIDFVTLSYERFRLISETNVFNLFDHHPL